MLATQRPHGGNHEPEPLGTGLGPRPWAPMPGLLHWWEFVSRVSSVNIISPGCPSFIAHFHWISFWLSFLNIYPLRAGLAGRSNTQPGLLVEPTRCLAPSSDFIHSSQPPASGSYCPGGAERSACEKGVPKGEGKPHSLAQRQLFPLRTAPGFGSHSVHTHSLPIHPWRAENRAPCHTGTPRWEPRGLRPVMVNMPTWETPLIFQLEANTSATPTVETLFLSHMY